MSSRRPLPKFAGLFLIVALLAGCATASVQDESAPPLTDPETSENTSAASREGESEPQELSDELLFEYLVGDIAARRGAPNVAAEAMYRAAELSRDPQIIGRAFRLALRAGHKEQTLALGKLMLSVEPESIGASLLMAQAHIENDQLDDVVVVLLEMIEQNPDDVAVLFRRIGELFARQREPSRYIDAFEQLVAAYPKVPESHYSLSFLASRAGDEAVLLDAVDQALALRPGWQDAALVKLAFFYQTNKTEELDRFAENFLEDYPNRVGFRMQWARMLAERQSNQAALKQLDRVIRDDRDNADAIYAAALLHSQEGDNKSAAKLLKRHLEIAPDHDQSRIYLGQLAQQEGRYDEALAWYRAVTDREFRLDAQIRAASVLADQDKVDDAIEEIRRIVPASAGDQVRLYLAQEQLLREAGRKDDALEIMNAALIEMPDDTELLYTRGLLAAQMNRVALHEQDLRRLLELEPDNAHAYNALGYTLADLTDRYQEALELIEKALELSPEDPFILDSMGWIQYRLGNNSDAIRYLELALNTRPDAEIAAHLGEVLWVTGEQERARSIWEQGKDIDPENSTLIETIRKFSE